MKDSAVLDCEAVGQLRRRWVLTLPDGSVHRSQYRYDLIDLATGPVRLTEAARKAWGGEAPEVV